MYSCVCVLVWSWQVFIGDLVAKLHGLQKQEELHNDGIDLPQLHIYPARPGSADRDMLHWGSERTPSTNLALATCQEEGWTTKQARPNPASIPLQVFPFVQNFNPWGTTNTTSKRYLPEPARTSKHNKKRTIRTLMMIPKHSLHLTNNQITLFCFSSFLHFISWFRGPARVCLKRQHVMSPRKRSQSRVCARVSGLSCFAHKHSSHAPQPPALFTSTRTHIKYTQKIHTNGRTVYTCAYNTHMMHSTWYITRTQFTICQQIYTLHTRIPNQLRLNTHER